MHNVFEKIKKYISFIAIGAISAAAFIFGAILHSNGNSTTDYREKCGDIDERLRRDKQAEQSIRETIAEIRSNKQSKDDC